MSKDPMGVKVLGITLEKAQITIELDVASGSGYISVGPRSKLERLLSRDGKDLGLFKRVDWTERHALEKNLAVTLCDWVKRYGGGHRPDD